MKNPQISIIFPVYNAESFLKESLDSIFNQTFKDFELIAVDDSSADNSFKILTNYAKKYSNIVLLKNNQNLGVTKTLNKALKLARGEFIARMDADDIMYRDRLKKQYDFLTRNPEYVLVGGQVNLINSEGTLIGKKTFPLDHDSIYKTLYTYMPLQHPAIMISRSKIPKNFPWYREEMRTAEDADLFYRLLKYGKFANLSDFILKYRQHPDAVSYRMTRDLFKYTKIARRNAVIEYGYKPTLFARFIDVLQTLVVGILPMRLIFPVYWLYRKLFSKRVFLL